MSPKILLLTLPFLLAGCSSLSEEECRAMSWYNLGYQDGEQGKTRQATRDYV
ncbi:MAG: DNA repair protein, partial [Aeromonas sp.]|nr:DNA repair protein [Aeromonas sp.]